jgi:PknH-like extracellular domain
MKKGQCMRQLRSAAAIAAIGMLVAACGGNDQKSPASTTKTTTTTTTTTPRPALGQAALANLLLSPADIDGVLGATGTMSSKKNDKLFDGNDLKQMMPAGWQFPDECLYAFGPAGASVYAGSGNTAVSVEDDTTVPAGSNLTQAVVLFPSANEANAFFTTSSQRWQACANRQITPPTNPDNVVIDFKVGPVSNANATLTTTLTVDMNNPAPGGAPITSSCQRALTVRNNVAIDVNGCSNGDLAVKVVNQIAGKVDNQGKVDSANINTLAGSLAKGYSLSNCQPAVADKLTFLSFAEIDCGQNADSSGPASAVYRLLGHGEALNAEFKAFIKDVSQTPCVDGGQTPMTWQQGQTSGQEACGTQNGVATITWTTDGKNVLASIRSSNTDVNALRQWWLANA